jgi:ATP phosphoribosyltransferase regulatory subunit
MRLRQERVTHWQQVPDGVKDLAPAEAERRSALAARLREQFARWGYREVLTPTLEYLETILHGAGPGIQDQVVKIVDGAELLALRPEMTVPIARLAATRLLRGAAAPLRLSYVATVFRRQEPGQGRLREFTQAGVELLGERSLDGDAEIIALAVESLRLARVPGAIVHVGHLGLLSDLLAGLSDDQRSEVRARLYRREFVGIEDVLPDRPVARLLRALPELHGSAGLARASSLATSAVSRAALEELTELLQRLQAYGVADAVEIDLGVIRDFSYYTGVVFEASGQGVGYPLLGGGRYDTLLARFNADCPATGFALGLERVLAAAPEEPPVPPDLLIVADERTRAGSVELATDLRRAGLRVLVTIAMDWPVAVQWAATEGIARVARLEGEEIWLRDLRAQSEGSTGRRQLIATLTRQPEAGITWSH